MVPPWFLGMEVVGCLAVVKCLCLNDSAVVCGSVNPRVKYCVADLLVLV